MKTLKVLLQEVTAGIKAWANANFSLGTHVHGNITNNGKVGTAANKPLITGTGGVVQAGSFGTSANTFCEGNDSRLSDARTPVAHTHTKSDVTNLFNSANTWSGDNSYSKNIQFTANFDVGVAPASEKKVGTVFGNGVTNLISAQNIIGTSGVTYFTIIAGNRFDNGALNPSGSIKYATLQVGVRGNGDAFIYTDCRWRNNLLPYTADNASLGSSTDQWNNLYAKNYFYNGTAWGLDKSNVWSGVNTFTTTIVAKGSIAASVPGYDVGIAFRDYQGTRYGYMQPHITSNNDKNIVIGADNGDVEYNSNIIPYASNVINLGTITNKWKTLNGVNPGALSLPDTSKSTEIDTTSWDKRATNGGIGTVTGSVDGWINVQIQRDVDFSVWVIGTYRQLYRAGLQGNGKYLVMVMYPITASATVTLYTLALATTESDLTFGVRRFYPSLGNV